MSPKHRAIPSLLDRTLSHQKPHPAAVSAHASLAQVIPAVAPAWRDTLGQLGGTAALIALGGLAVQHTLLLPLGWAALTLACIRAWQLGVSAASNRLLPNAPWLAEALGMLVLLPLGVPLSTLRLAWQANAIDRVPLWGAGLDLAQFRFESNSQLRRTRAQVWFVYAVYAGLIACAVQYWGVSSIVWWWGVPFVAFQAWHHASLSLEPIVYDAERDTHVFTYYQLPAWLEALCLWYNFRVPHILGFDVPCYKLGEVKEAMLRSEWAREHLVVFRFGSGLFNAPVNSTEDEDTTEKPHATRRGASPGGKNARAASPGRKGRGSRAKGAKHASTGAAKGKSMAARLFHYIVHELNWLHVPLLVGTPLIALYGALTTPLEQKTLVWAVLYYFFTGFGITGGYHRLWSHKSYEASKAFTLFLLAAGTGAVEGSVRWWCRDHRAHHRYTDTPKDPYSISNGLLWAHMGWMMHKQDPAKIGRADISDLNKDPWIRFQHRYYVWLALFWGFIFPTLVAGYGWGDFRGGFYYAAVARLVFVHHATFCVNSVAHYFGDHVYADHLSPRDSFVTALLTLGEGYHNFHHEFPSDYRNAIRAWQYDPTKWAIRVAAFFGLTYNLQRFPENEIQKGKLQIQQKKLHEKAKRLNWGFKASEMKTVSMEEIVRGKDDVVVIDGFVYDVTDFVSQHPGGPAILKGYLRKDATDAFNGMVYNHSNAARNLLDSFRIARVESSVDDAPVEERDAEEDPAFRVHYHDHKSAFGNAYHVPYIVDASTKDV